MNIFLLSLESQCSLYQHRLSRVEHPPSQYDATTSELIDAFECASEVSGIQFNVELEQVATSHNDFSREDATRHIHGEEGTVQFWEFNTSNKLNPVQKISYHKSGIISMAASVNSSQLLTLGGDEKLCLWNWKNKTAPHSNKNSEAGFQTTRSQLDSAGSEGYSIYIDVFRGGYLNQSSLYPSLREQAAASVESVLFEMLDVLTDFLWNQYGEYGLERVRYDQPFFVRLECSMSPQDPNIITCYAEHCIRLGIQLDDAIQLLQNYFQSPE